MNDSIPPPVAIDLPETWTRRTDFPPFALVAWPSDDERHVRPNVIVTVTHRGDRDLRAWAEEQIGELGATFPEPVLIDMHLDRAESRLSFTLAHAAGGVDRTLHQQHLLLDDGWVLATSVTVADVDWPLLAREMTTVARSTRAAGSNDEDS